VQEGNGLRQWLFGLTRRKWKRLLWHAIGEGMGEKERQMLMDLPRRAKTREQLLDKLVAFGQDLEMSAGLARLQQPSMYEERLLSAARCYQFVMHHTSRPELKHRMQKAEEEIRKRLSVAP
jgi:hypothetical protein